MVLHFLTERSLMCHFPRRLQAVKLTVDDGADWPSRLDVYTLFLCGVNGQNYFRHVGTGGNELVNLLDVIC